DLVCGDGSAEQETLAVAAVVLEEELALFVCFDSLGERFEAEGVRKLDDGGDELARVLAVVEIPDEGAVDLEHVDPGLVEPTERGVAGAEVVDRELEAVLTH